MIRVLPGHAGKREEFLFFKRTKNSRGKFVSVTEYGTQKHKGSVVIPEGHDRWGWRGFSQALNGLLGHTQLANNQPSSSQGFPQPPSSR